MNPSKDIIISYAAADKEVAIAFKKVLEEWFGDNIWMRDFNLSAGEVVHKALDAAITDAKWFLVLLTKASVSNGWLATEADLATFRSIEDSNFKIIVLWIDDAQPPRHLEIALKTQYVVDLRGIKVLENEFIRVAEYIEHSLGGTTQHEVYVDRGGDTDRFSLIARRNRIIFILGWAGIGKSSFVEKSVATLLRKRPLSIKLSRGHSGDLLSRQIMEATHVRQPLDVEGSGPDETELLDMAITGIKSRATTHFLFLDNAEEGLNPSNQLLPFLNRLLIRIKQEDIDTHVAIATTRNPDYPAEISACTDLLLLEGLADEYIGESIDLWLQDTPVAKDVMKSHFGPEIIELIDGYPLAAKMAASFLKVNSPDQLLIAKERKRFSSKFAEYIIRAADQNSDALTDVHRLMLEILATVQGPMSLRDMLSVKELEKYDLETIHQARLDLTNLFFITQHGDEMHLHSFLASFYLDRLKEDRERLDGIAEGFGRYAYNRVIYLNERLISLQNQDTMDSETAVKITNEMFRYALPAASLLFSVGLNELAENLPIKVEGTLRRMAFFFYQEKPDHSRALEYAEKWLKLYPDDTEVALLRIRCHRSIGDKDNLKKGQILIEMLEKGRMDKRLAARLYREKALIAEKFGDADQAKHYYREGIAIDKNRPYAENYVGLARLILDDAERMPVNEHQQDLAEEVISLLDVARADMTNFDRFHFGLYLSALIVAGREDYALPLLEEALSERPTDGRLNFRMAEIQRKRGFLEAADHYAKIAIRNGVHEAEITRANIMYSQENYQDALSIALRYAPQVSHAHAVKDALLSKIYRTMNRWDDADVVLNKHKNTQDPYLIYERCRIFLHQADIAEAAGRREEAVKQLSFASKEISQINYRRISQLRELLDEVRNRQIRIVQSSIQS